MKILFHRHTEWQAKIRCSTNIFAKLAIESGHDVTYMHGMVHLGNLLAKNGRWKFWKKGLRFEYGANVFTPLSLVPFSKQKPFNRVWASHQSYLTCMPSIDSQLKKINFQPDVIWSANPGSIALKKIYPDAHFIFQIVDFYPAFSGDSIREIEHADYHGADSIFVIGDTLKNYIINEHKISPEKITVLGQGVFTERYQSELEIPTDMSNLPRPIAIWVGVNSKCDRQLFAEAASSLKKMGGSLVMIGPKSDWEDQLITEFGNVYLLGAKDPVDVPKYLVNADIGLMLYDQSRQEIYRGQNPLKLYEYAAASLPIISTHHDEYEYLNPPVLIVDKNNTVSDAISSALKDKNDYAKKAHLFVKDRNWSSIYKRAQSFFL